MAEENNTTEQALIDSFKNLMMNTPFEKITIKKITDGANVIRPTFYNYFSDKYMIFETILDKELFDTLYSLVDLNMLSEVVSVIFAYFDKNKKFYQKSFDIDGQNSFNEILTTKMQIFYAHILQKYPLKDEETVNVLGTENVARYYAIGLIYIIYNYCNNTEDKYDANFFAKAYNYLVSHSLSDIFQNDDTS